jgi:N-acetylglucosaminyldiphosphoundecaprenol N-acetyl-beta-D-mannosaminyltransferase
VEQIFGPTGEPNYASQKILGIRFFNGDVDQAIDRMFRSGGTVVVPAAPALVKLRYENEDYRRALTQADLAIADSGLMVLLWKFLRGRKISRISGLKYLQHLTARCLAEKQHSVLWVLPNESAREKTARWLSANRTPFADIDLYVAPHYSPVVEDRQLLDKIEQQRPAHIVIGIGNGPQEKLGRYLRDRLGYRPAIHCIGAALGFLTGEQVAIPGWADRFYLGWVFRLLRQPRIFIPRLTRALELPWLIWKYGEALPRARQRDHSTTDQ